MMKHLSKMKLTLQPALIFLSCLIVLTQSFYALPFELFHQSAGTPRNTTNQTTQDREPVGLINPTVIQATTYENCTDQKCVVIFRTRFVTYELALGKVVGVPFGSITKPPSPNPTGPVYVNSIMIGEKLDISLADQMNYAHSNFMEVYGGNSSSKSMAINDKFTCAMDTPIAAEKLSKGEKDYFLGVYDTYICLVELKPDSKGSIFDRLNKIKSDSSASEKQPIRLPVSDEKKANPENFFKISAIAILPNEGHIVHAVVFDEGGRISSYKFPLESKNKAVKIEQAQEYDSFTLSQLPLIDIYGDKNETAPDMLALMSNDIAKTMKKNLTEMQKRKLNEHYDLAFIESITYFNGAVCFSRGLKIVTKPPVRCLSGKPFKQLPSELITKLPHNGTDHPTILALEVFELNDSTINYHAVYQHVSGQVVSSSPYEFVDKPRYWFCSVKKSSSGSYEGPKFGTGDKNSSCTDIRIHRIPIDIVQIKSDKCNYLVSFYRYMYQMNKINEGIHDAGKAVFAPWMAPDANAVMSHKDKLYFFLSGNTLNVYDYNPNKCDSLEVNKNYKEFFSSELLRVFAKTYVVKNTRSYLSRSNVTMSDDYFKGHLFEDGPPIYTGYRQQSGNELFPQIGFQKLIDDAYLIGWFGSGKTEPSSSSSMWTLVLLILIVLVLLIAILYYVFFSGNQESYNVIELKKLTSKSKKNVATSSGAGSPGITSPTSSAKKRADAVVHSSKQSQQNSSKHILNSPKSSTKLHSLSKSGHHSSSSQTNQSQKVSFASPSSKSKKRPKSAKSNKSSHHAKGDKSKIHKSLSAKTPRSPSVRLS